MPGSQVEWQPQRLSKRCSQPSANSNTFQPNVMARQYRARWTSSSIFQADRSCGMVGNPWSIGLRPVLLRYGQRAGCRVVGLIAFRNGIRRIRYGLKGIFSAGPFDRSPEAYASRLANPTKYVQKE